MPENLGRNLGGRGSEKGEVKASYALKLKTTAGLYVSIGIKPPKALDQTMTQTPHSWVMGVTKIATSERGHVVYSAKGRRRLVEWNSGLPKRPKLHGNGCAVVRCNPFREAYTQGRKTEGSPKPKAHAGRGSLGEMLTLDKDGRCNNAYDVICMENTLQSAYVKIKSKPGNMTPGSDQETLDGITQS